LFTSGLIAGQKHVNRWESDETVFDYSYPHSIHGFTALIDVESYSEQESFMSNSAVYFRGIVESDATLL